ncbi:T3SS effector HopA1 family protein [Myxococcota bacterium]|nr:T3SS effector HopA1 family protein [Myxococcota bacterium]
MDLERDPLRRRFISHAPPIDTPDARRAPTPQSTDGPTLDARAIDPPTREPSKTDAARTDAHAPAPSSVFADVKLSGSPDYHVDRLTSTLTRAERRSLERSTEDALRRGDPARLERCARALVDHLHTHARDDVGAIAATRLVLAEAQLAQGKVLDARATIGRSIPEHLPSDALQDRRSAVLEKIVELQRRMELRERQAQKFQAEYGAIALLANEPAPERRAEARRRAEVLLDKTLRAAGSAPAAVEAARSLVAFTTLQSGDVRGALVAFEALVRSASAPVAANARAMIGAIEAAELEHVAEKARLEQLELEALKAAKLPDSKLALASPITAYRVISGHFDALHQGHEAALAKLGDVTTGAKVAAALIRRHGLRLDDLRAMPDAKLVALAGREGARAIRELSKLSDARNIAAGSAALDVRSWRASPPETYVDRNYLDSRFDVFARRLGDFMRESYSVADRARRSPDFWTSKAAEYSVSVMDAWTGFDAVLDEGLKNAREYYLAPTRSDGAAGVAGKGVVFVLDAVGATVMMPTKILDPKVDDATRAHALEDALVTVTGVGIAKAAGALRPGVARALAESSAVERAAATTLGRRALATATYELFTPLARALKTPLFGTGAGQSDDAIARAIAETSAVEVPAATPVAPSSVARRRPPPPPAMSVEDFVEAAIDRPFEDLSGMRHLGPTALADDLYRDVYARARAPKGATISQEEHVTRLARLPHVTTPGDGWVFFESPGFARDGLQRFYLNVLPDDAAQLGARLFDALDAAEIPFRFKLPHTIDGFRRADSGVLWVAREHGAAAEEVVRRVAAELPEALTDGVPPLTRSVTRGVGAADEPIQGHFDYEQSFGGSRCHIIAEGICHSPPNTSRAEVIEYVRRNFREYGIDPDTPWANDSWSEATKERVVDAAATSP